MSVVFYCLGLVHDTAFSCGILYRPIHKIPWGIGEEGEKMVSSQGFPSKALGCLYTCWFTLIKVDGIPFRINHAIFNVFLSVAQYGLCSYVN
ncbi:hypothetical protein [Bacillus sp. 71mf]|uniref:hypothetical protein n=1 Tax=Bacillus sp. 71mf TaxID=1761757 RepID=UPI0011134336|nr:hypothetical protein [Bacillus sp. 71mf]